MPDQHIAAPAQDEQAQRAIWERQCPDLLAERDRLDRQLTAVLAETTRWQRDAQTTEEKAWANVFRANVTRAMQEADLD